MVGLPRESRISRAIILVILLIIFSLRNIEERWALPLQKTGFHLIYRELASNFTAMPESLKDYLLQRARRMRRKQKYLYLLLMIWINFCDKTKLQESNE
ncbi:hypothetical protein BMS3Bbin11_00442 [bacterium BMS3Bbin11]|nr:hypothetical protein BMS3Bbin11_00442 [bacterium BMS3Bbin11]